MHICIYGYGLEGKSTEGFLTKHFEDLTITIFDENIKGKDKFSPASYDLIFVSPGVDRGKIDKEFWPKCTSQIEYFFTLLPEEKRQKMIGITGSKGKSTTTKFCAEFLEKAGFKARIAGNFGVPFLDILDDFLMDKFDYLVAEISSYQAEFCQQSPHITIFLSFFPEHLERHGTEQAYLSAKANCWRHQADGDFLIMPQGLAPLSDLVKICPRENRLLLAEPLSEDYFPKNASFRIPHFCQNFGTMTALASVLNIKKAEDFLQATAKSFVGLPHRNELVGKAKGMSFYNDSIATAPEAVIGTVKFFGKDLAYLLLGGQHGGDSFDRLVQALVAETFVGKVLITDSPILEPFEAAAKAQAFTAYEVVPDFTVAMEKVLSAPKKGKVCLLAPAGKSFDQYPNYAARGDHFRELVGRG